MAALAKLSRKTQKNSCVNTCLLVQVVVGILQRCEARLLEMRDMERMVAFLKVEVPQWRHDTLQVRPTTPPSCMLALFLVLGLEKPIQFAVTPSIPTC